MIDFTHKKRPDFVQLILLIAVVCLALGAISPAVSAIEYDNISYQSPDVIYNQTVPPEKYIYNFAGSDFTFYMNHLSFTSGANGDYYTGTLSDYLSVNSYTSLPVHRMEPAWAGGLVFANLDYPVGTTSSEKSDYINNLVSWLDANSNMPDDTLLYTRDWGNPRTMWTVVFDWDMYDGGFGYDPVLSDESLDISLTAFAPDDPHGMYVLSLDGALLDTTYTVGINRYTGEFKYLIDSYAYSDGSGSYTFTGSRSLTFPIFYNSFTNMPYSYEVSVNVNDEDGYLDKRYLVYWSDLGGLYDTVPEPLVPTPTPTPTVTFVPSVPVDPSDLIPEPSELDNMVNIIGWYQDQGFEDNSITAPIYSGLRGFFTDNLIPFFDFFLVPTNYVATVISDSAETSTDGIYYITEELGSYAAPFNMVGAYVVRLVPEVVWVVVFAALSIGYVVLLIRVSTGSIKETIGRFLGGSK